MKKSKAIIVKRKKSFYVLITLLVIITLLASSVTLFMFNNKLKSFDYYLGNVVLNRVANAQYVPIASTLSAANTSNLSLSASDNYADELNGNDNVYEPALSPNENNSNDNNSNVTGRVLNFNPACTLSDYQKLVDNLGNIITDDQQGLHNGFLHINSVKDEVYNTIAKAPAFDIWFAEAAGMQGIIRGREYYVHYDESSQHISITCVSNGTDTAIINYDNGKEKIKGDRFFSPMLKQLMQLEYYYNDEGKEVVEMYVYSTLIHKNKTYPISYQYLKNIRDSSFTKVYVNANIRTSPTEYYMNSDADYCRGAHDLENFNQYGTLRRFIQLDYNDVNQVNLMVADQYIPNFYYSAPQATSVRLYSRTGNNIVYYNTSYDYSTVENNSISTWRNPTNELSFYPYNNGLIDVITGFGNRPADYFIKICQDCFSTATKMERCTHYTSAATVQRQTYEINKLSIYSLTAYHKQMQIVTKLAGNIGLSEDKIYDFRQIDYNSYVLGDLRFENSFDNFLDEITKHFVDNFTLRDNADEIIKSASKSKTVDINASVSATRDMLKINDIDNSGTIREGVINYSITGSVEPTILLKGGSEYSLSLVLCSGNYSYVLGSKYAEYSGEQLTYDYQGTYDFTDLEITLNGEYKLAVALTGVFNGKEVIFSDLKDIVLDYQAFYKDDTITDYHTTYEIYYTDAMYIKSEVLDIQAPTLVFENESKTVTFIGETLAGYILNHFTVIEDNEMIASIKIYDSEDNRIDWKTPIESGDYTIIVIDTSGNTATDTIKVIVISVE